MADTFFLGYCDDTRALLAHLDVEAARRAASVRVLDPDPRVVEALCERGVNATTADLWDAAALRAAGVDGAKTVVAFAERVGGSTHRLERVVRAVCPTARFFVVP